MTTENTAPAEQPYERTSGPVHARFGLTEIGTQAPSFRAG